MNHFKVNNPVIFSTYTMLCNDQLYPVPKHFHHSKRKSHTHYTVAPPSLLPIQALATTDLLSVSMDPPIMNVPSNRITEHGTFVSVFFRSAWVLGSSILYHSFLLWLILSYYMCTSQFL